MKVLSIVVLCALAVYVKSDEEFVPNQMQHITECKDEVSASDEDVAAMAKHQAPTTPEGMCLHACFMKKNGMMNEEGKMMREGVIGFIKRWANGDEEKEKKGVEILDACYNIEVPTNHCEAAAAYNACVQKQMKEKNLKQQ